MLGEHTHDSACRGLEDQWPRIHTMLGLRGGGGGLDFVWCSSAVSSVMRCVDCSLSFVRVFGFGDNWRSTALYTGISPCIFSLVCSRLTVSALLNRVE